MTTTIQTATRKIDWLPGHRTGWGNGYVGVPPGHPWFGIDYDSIQASTHGGLTYASDHHPVQHTQDGLWWVGFDTGHHGDTPDNCPESYVIAKTEDLRRHAEEVAALHQSIHERLP